MEADEGNHKVDSSHKGAVDYFAYEFYPGLQAQVLGLRDVIELLTINILPLAVSVEIQARLTPAP